MLDVNDSVTAIRNAISYVRSGTNRQRAFELKVDSGRMKRGSLPLDVVTRWNSTYLMLQRALIYKTAFDKMGFEDKPYNDHFMELDKGKKRLGPPVSEDWRAVGRLERFLIIFYNSTLVVSASTTLCAHKCYGEIVNIASNLKLLCNSYDTDLKVKAEDMLMKFDKYWDGLKNINKILVVASVFDPSRKMKFAKLCFEDLYGEDSMESKELNDSVLSILTDLFKEYSERNGKQAEANVQSSQSTQSTQSSQSQEQPTIDLLDDELGYHRIEKKYSTLLKESGVRDINELEAYLKADVENSDSMLGTDYDVLSWWKVNSGKYPILSQIARDLFAMQVSSVASESAFSTSGRLIDPHRSCLTHYMVEVLMCTEQWMKQDIRLESKVLTNAQILGDVEYEEKMERGL
ncbi:zinc finger BED domain-containing protein RICESLEEPER 2-like [Brassica napus]|uniref:zinc finger BED domain-containing protein RICESLEEPER 2-like n=1 Tax=Brassica napus TaxID=3708 RepID=UPI002078E3CA|nr:zinc finger BED domain-containing protein RICESLEEPER 2-like [Brassica napus]